MKFIGVMKDGKSFKMLLSNFLITTKLKKTERKLNKTFGQQIVLSNHTPAAFLKLSH